MASCTDIQKQQAYSKLQYTVFEAFLFVLSRASVVGIAISYGLDGPGFESSQGHEIFSFSKLSRLVLGPSQLPIQWVTWFYSGVWIWALPPPIQFRGSKQVEPCPNSLYMPSWGGQELYSLVFVFILRYVTIAAFILLTELRNKCKCERNCIRNQSSFFRIWNSVLL